ncbi:MAG: alpha-E domain-containing protein, partial [Bacillus sp. (in: firmicutes)]
MLNRIVASFYWIGRYSERIDYTARLADVNIYGHYKLSDNEEYYNSLMTNLTFVRNNVREIRQYATNRMWDCINGFYLWLSDHDHAAEHRPFK